MDTVSAPLILVVEDDAEICNVLCTFLEDRQHRVVIANDRATASDILQKLNPDLLIADIILQGGNGNSLAKLARSKGVPVLLMSGEPQSIRQLYEESAPFLQKPFRLSELEQRINDMLNADRTNGTD